MALPCLLSTNVQITVKIGESMSLIWWPSRQVNTSLLCIKTDQKSTVTEHFVQQTAQAKYADVDKRSIKWTNTEHAL